MQWAIRGIRTFSNTVSYQSIKLYIPFSWKKESKASVRGKKGLISSQKCKIAPETTSSSKHSLSLPSCLASTSVRNDGRHTVRQCRPFEWQNIRQMSRQQVPEDICVKWQLPNHSGTQGGSNKRTTPPSVETWMIFPGAISSSNFIIYNLKQTQHNIQGRWRDLNICIWCGGGGGLMSDSAFVRWPSLRQVNVQSS